MRLKHNKKRNTAFLFEVLAKELTKSIVAKEKKKKKGCTECFKRIF